MTVTEVWRFPVKTMAGERLRRARLGPLGIESDRVVHVEGVDGRVVTSRTHPRFLGLKGTMGLDGEPLVDGRPWNTPEVAARGIYERFEGQLALNCIVIEGGDIAVGDDVRLVRGRGCAEAATGRFDK